MKIKNNAIGSVPHFTNVLLTLFNSLRVERIFAHRARKPLAKLLARLWHTSQKNQTHYFLHFCFLFLR